MPGRVDRVTPEELERLARSIAMSPGLGQRDRLTVSDALRRLAEVERRPLEQSSGHSP
jgi:hypothetical protein